jgi:tRNA pseudouridine38-40 synthase
MNKNSYKIILSYDGTAYQGWQKNRELPTIEKELEKSLQTLGFHFFKIEGASRTDAGVHATGQVVRLDLEKCPTSTRALLLGINSQLPKPIQVIELISIDPEFHPTLAAKTKTYTYEICTGPSQHPRHRLYSWHVPYTLHIDSMRQAAQRLEGTHNFQAFTNRKNNESYDNFLRTLYQVQILELEPARLKIVVQGNRFMYKMVRNIVGLLIQVGRGKLEPCEVSAVIESRNRCKAPLTAPAHGLCLTHIEY